MVHGNGETLLLVEDEPLALAAVEAVLSHLGYRVLTAMNGREALAVYKEHRLEIALVLSDMVLPDLEGAALFHLLKAQTPNLKMIVMSGYPLHEDGAALLEQGMVEWLHKPPSFSYLSRVIREALLRP